MSVGNNPVALPLLFAVLSLVAAGYSWSSTPDKLPLWWSVHGHPLVWIPKWLGLLLFPFLGLVIPYAMYMVAARDQMLDGQSGESAYAIANIITLPSVLFFAVYVMVYLKAAEASNHTLPSRIFTSNIAVWALFWLGYNLQYVAPNTSIGVPVFSAGADLWATIHRRAGWGLMVAGLVLFVFAQACPVGVAFFVVSLVIWLGAYAIAILYSYYLSREMRSSAAAEGQRDGGEDSNQEPLLPSSQA